MKKVLKTFLIFSAFFNTASIADESISALLKQYEKVGRLEYKTVEEGEGHVIIFTKEDLERMQAFTLKDVLKTIKFYHVYLDRYGDYLFNYSLLSNEYVKTVRLYINDHEISDIFSRSPFNIWDNIPLDHIDHIEIYLGESAIKFGNEYASVLIKLYTKEPEKENILYTRVTKDIRKGYGISIYDAREINGNSSYMVMINRSEFDYKKLDGLNRDSSINYGYFYLRYGDNFLNAGYMKKKSANFLGSALDNFLDYGSSKANHKYISLTTYLFEDKSLKLNISFDDIEHENIEEDQNGLLSCIPNPSLVFRYSDIKINEYSSNFFIQKKYEFENNKLFISAVYKNRGFSFTKNGNLLDNSPLFLKDNYTEDYFSILAQGETNIKNNLLFVTGIRFDSYQRPSDLKDMKGFMIKTELVHKVKKDIYYKIFGGSFFAPVSFLKALNNPSIDIQKNKLVTVELEKNYEKGDIILAVGRMFIEDAIYLNPLTFRFENLDKDVSFTFYSIYAKLKISKTGKILFDFFKIDPSEDIVIPFSSREGAGFHIFERLGKFDTYLGIIYRGAYTVDTLDIDEGIDITLSIKYNINDKLAIGIKGENLLNKALKIPYLGIHGISTYPSIDRNIFITVVSNF